MSAMRETTHARTWRQRTLIGYKRTLLGRDIRNGGKDDKKSEKKCGNAGTRHDGEMELKEALQRGELKRGFGGLEIQIPIT